MTRIFLNFLNDPHNRVETFFLGVTGGTISVASFMSQAQGAISFAGSVLGLLAAGISVYKAVQNQSKHKDK